MISLCCFFVLFFFAVFNFVACFVQVTGKVPIISINKTDGCQVYLSKDSLSCEIVSAKSSEMNVLVPKSDGDFVSILASAIISEQCSEETKNELVWGASRLTSCWVPAQCNSYVKIVCQMTFAVLVFINTWRQTLGPSKYHVTVQNCVHR